MTYGATLQRTAEQRAQKPIPFLLSTKTEWFERTKSLLIGVVVEPVLPASFPPLKPPSGSSITLPAHREVTTVWQESGLSTIRTFELQFSLVEQLYIFRRRNEVISFLWAHLFLVPLLLEAHGKIAECFGPAPEVVLEVVTDPEVENDRELFALVRTNLSPSEALYRLDRLDQEWWLEASLQARCLLNIDVELA